MLENFFSEEIKYLQNGFNFVVGVDEAGRGPLAGPVVASAVAFRNFQDTRNNNQVILNDQIFNDQDLLKKYQLIRDSKTLSWNQKNKLYDFIQENFFVGVGVCDHKTIDRINILEATFLAMKKAVTALQSGISKSQLPISNQFSIYNDKILNDSKYEIRNTKYVVLVDGNKTIPNFSHDQISIVDGDNKVKSISAASIIAKVTRDRMMLEMHEKYPQYRFDLHKGYGTKVHIDALHQHGACEIHRLSFEPVKSLSKADNNVSIQPYYS